MKKILSALLLCAAVSFPAYSQGVHYFGQTDQDTVSQVPYGNNAAAGHFVKAGDARIYYEVYGKGEPVLVLHGGGVGCTYEMGRFIDELAKDHLVIAPSTRGHGKSEIGVKPITYAQKAEDMMAAVNQITKKPMVILGFSDGAYTAYKIAAMYPDRVRKIVAIGAGAFYAHHQTDLRPPVYACALPAFSELHPHPPFQFRWQQSGNYCAPDTL